MVRSIFSTGQVPLLEGALNQSLSSSREFIVRWGWGHNHTQQFLALSSSNSSSNSVTSLPSFLSSHSPQACSHQGYVVVTALLCFGSSCH